MKNRSKVDLFMSEQTGSACGLWQGSLDTDAQRAFFNGRYFGDGLITIDGGKRRVVHQRPSAPGRYETTIVATY